ncbi:MAG: adenylosuccinate lyase [bacterium]
MSNQLTNISPIDGRYCDQVSDLSDFFSEMALMKYRVLVEVRYLIALGDEKNVKEVKKFDNNTISFLDNLWRDFGINDAKEIKKIEEVTNHDVKAVEYFIKNKIIKLDFNKEFIHFALTSEDVNNLAGALQVKDAIEKVYLPAIKELLNNLKKLAKENKGVALLSLTHGQPATPTTLGKELAVFCFRLKDQIEKLEKNKVYGKLNGASGCFAAHNIAYPDVDWIGFSKVFVEGLGLNFNPLTTQIESHDSLVDIYGIISHINNILVDFDRDVWFYVSRGIFKQRTVKGEVGSSTMPHKVNPINFENSEGNLLTANALLGFFQNKLPISRMQRDLTDSTVLRNQGVAFAHSLLGVKSLLKGLSKLEVNKSVIKKELENNPEVLAEAIQTILRKVGYPKPYEKLKELTRGQKLDGDAIKKFVEGLDIDDGEKAKLLGLGAEGYVGLARELVEKFV